MSIRDRIANVIFDEMSYAGELPSHELANRILAACPEIAALDHAREGWQTRIGGADIVSYTYRDRYKAIQRRVLVVDAPKATP